MKNVKLYGASGSPYVRKVMVAMMEKGIEFEQVSVMPFNQDQEFQKKSPLRKIPCYEDDNVTLPDSSCILAYLDKKHADKRSLYPNDATQYAECLWLEEYADTKLVEITATPFFERFMAPKFMKRDTDEARIQKVMQEKAPAVFDYLESKVPENDFLFGQQLMAADISIATQFVNFKYGSEAIDAARWPKLAAYIERVHDTQHFQTCMIQDMKAFGG